MVNLQAYICSIQNLTGEDASKELVQFCRKWIEENGDKLSSTEADRVLNMLNPTQYTLGCVCIFLVKITKTKNEMELLECLRSLLNYLPNFDAKQLHWAPDIYNAIFEHVVDMFLKRNTPVWGIPILESAILTYNQGNSQYLTNLHPFLLCLCLKARHFDNVLPFLQVDVVQMFKQSGDGNTMSGRHDDEKANGVSSSEGAANQQAPSSITSSAVSFLQKAMNTVSGNLGTKPDEPKSMQPFLKRRMVLLYFYYGALIYGALERWEEAVLFLEHTICLPTKRNSVIVLEALKKFIIMSLIMGRKKPLEYLPTYRSPVIQRTFLSLAVNYIRIPNMIQRSMEKKLDVVAVLTNYFSDKRSSFSKDCNVGLMKILINACKENSVKRLGNIFVSLNLADVCRLAHFTLEDRPDQEPQQLDIVEQTILRLRQNNQLIAHIDSRTQTVHFAELNDAQGRNYRGHLIADEKPRFQDLDIDTALAEVFQLARVVHSFDDAIRLNPHFIEKSIQKSGRERGAGGNGSGGHNFSTIFPEDEGFYLTTGSP